MTSARRLRATATFLLVALCWTFAYGGDDEAVYDVIERSWSPYLSRENPAEFAMKIRAVSATPRSYWGGAKDLFFIWAKRECADWFQQHDRDVFCHADVHAGNIGTYPSAFGKLSVGLIDFDDAATLPVEIDLLQACISLRLAVVQNNITLSDAEATELCQGAIDRYNVASQSLSNATELLRDDAPITQLMRATTRPYHDQLERYTLDRRFRTTILNGKGDVKDILTPAMNRADELASALAASAKRSPQLGAMLCASDFATIRRSIRDIAIRTRLGSAGSQGLDKILILMHRPLHGVDGDVILYLKQEVPSAAERTGAAPPDARTPAQRVADAVAANCDPDPIINAACEAGGRSYLLSLFEPWGEELETVPVTTVDALMQRARIMGTVLGAAHRLRIADAAVQQQIIDRSARYLDVMFAEWKSLRNDPRTNGRIGEANAFIESARRKSQPVTTRPL